MRGRWRQAVSGISHCFVGAEHEGCRSRTTDEPTICNMRRRVRRTQATTRHITATNTIALVANAAERVDLAQDRDPRQERADVATDRRPTATASARGAHETRLREKVEGAGRQGRPIFSEI